MPEAEDLEKTLPNSPKKRKTKAVPLAEPAAEVPPDLAETQRVEIAPKLAAAPKPRRRRLRWAIALVIGFIAFVGLGALGGMQAGLSARSGAERMERAVEAETQFQLALADLQSGRCDLASQRFQYVSQLNPDYPGILEQLSQALLCASGTATPQPGAEAGPTPTPDLRGVEQAYADSLALLAAQNWDQLLLTLDTLRTNFPDYQPIEVDRMYYTALRNRGVVRILQVGDLEGGIYDLNRAAQIGPLDAEATNYRQWAISYIVGQSFWEVDWAQAIEYFQPLSVAAPSLHDLNFFTSQDRYATAAAFYSLDLVREAERLAANKLWCSAEQMMGQANGYAPLAPEVQPTADWYTEKCLLNGDEG